MEPDFRYSLRSMEVIRNPLSTKKIITPIDPRSGFSHPTSVASQKCSSRTRVMARARKASRPLITLVFRMPANSRLMVERSGAWLLSASAVLAFTFRHGPTAGGRSSVRWHLGVRTLEKRHPSRTVPKWIGLGAGEMPMSQVWHLQPQRQRRMGLAESVPGLSACRRSRSDSTGRRGVSYRWMPSLRI